MKKTKLYLTQAKWRFVLHSLNALKTKLHHEGQYTDAVDDALYKVISAPTKRIRVGVQ